MLGRTLVTHQTGPIGKQRKPHLYRGRIGDSIDRELYLAIAGGSGQTSRISFVCSTEGGMDIEEVAASNTPEKILSFRRGSCQLAIKRFHGRRKVAFALGLQGARRSSNAWRSMGHALQDAFVEKDMEMLEINPLIVTDGRST